MNRAASTLVLTLACLALPAAAAQGVVENRSSVAADGTRTLELRIAVPAAADEVWRAWTTSEGFASWAAPMARVDFRVGGAIEASYNPQAKPGDRENIVNEIVAIVPGSVFVIRNVQAPTRTPFDVPAFQSLQTGVLLEPRGPAETLVTVVMPGVGSGPAFDGVYKHFAWGNAWTLEQLRKRFVEGPTDWAKKAPAPRAAGN